MCLTKLEQLKLDLAESWRILCIRHGVTHVLVQQTIKGANPGSRILYFGSSQKTVKDYFLDRDIVSHHDYMVKTAKDEKGQDIAFHAHWCHGHAGTEKDPSISFLILPVGNPQVLALMAKDLLSTR